jgi:hypothetical protein
MNLFAAAVGAISQGVQLFQALAGVTQIASAAQAVFNAVMALNPVVLVVAAVTALIAAVALLIVYWDQVKEALRDNPWLAVAATLFGIIGIIVVIIAYWDEIKLAVLQAANFISIQVQRIGQFFVGLGTLLGQVWDAIVATLYNAGVSIINFFIQLGADILNIFIRLINGIIDLYNDVADVVPGLDEIEQIAEVQPELVQKRDVPQISVEAAFASAAPTSGGLEESIAAQQAIVRQSQTADAERQRRSQEAATAAAPALPSGAALPSALPAAVPMPSGGSGAVDQSVRVEGGITVNINAERLEADAAEFLSDEIIRRIQERLSELRSEQQFRTGMRGAGA